MNIAQRSLKSLQEPSQPGQIYLAAIVLAEAVTALLSPEIGLFLHSLLIVALLFHAVSLAEHPVHRLLLALMFAPLIRIISLAIPLGPIPTLYWYIIMGTPMLAAAFVFLRSLNIPPEAAGLTRGENPLLQMVAVASGFPLGYIEYLILKPAPLVDNGQIFSLLLAALILIIFTGLMEELIFRGIIQPMASSIFGRHAILYTAILFAVLHLGYRSIPDLIVVFAAGMFFGWVTEKTGSIWGVTLGHGLTNIMLLLILPLAA